MIVLHVALFFRRVRAEAEPIRDLGQGVFDRFCTDIANNLRELGISDLEVPKEMRRRGEAFYGRATAYEWALACPDDLPLIEALGRNLFGGTLVPGAPRLASYVRATVDALAHQSSAAFSRGALQFPDPATIPARGVPG